MPRRAFWSAVMCVSLPGVATAQRPPGEGIVFGHYPHGPRVAPPWGYPGLSGGPYVGYPVPGTPGYPACGYPRNFFGPGDPGGPLLSHGLSFCRPPVPTYAPLPATFNKDDLDRLWRSTLTPGLAGYGWIGIYNISPRPRPRTVSTWPTAVGPGASPTSASVMAANAGSCLVLSVRVPESAAEVLVDGKKTQQTGTDRTFESPPLEAGKGYEYTVTARWVERGQVVEVTKVVSGAPGDVIRVDFGAPAVATGK